MIKWRKKATFGLHFDFHANASDKDLFKNLTEQNLFAELNKIKPDFVQCDCKGHAGYTSYPSKLGNSSPGISSVDGLKIWRSVTAKMGIPLIMHYSGVWDTLAITKHPEWALVRSAKTATQPEIRDADATCPRSNYVTDLVIPQMIELIDNYKVDGFWIDGDNWMSGSCYCDKCVKAYYNLTGHNAPTSKDDENWLEWQDFGRNSYTEYVNKYVTAIHNYNPDIAICSNWLYTLRQPDNISINVDWLSGDLTFSNSVKSAEFEARFLNGRHKDWDLVAWTFTSWGEYKDYVFKTLPAICQECATIMSNGGTVLLYDTPERSGELVSWHMDTIAKVADFCRQRTPIVKDTSPIPQIATLHSRNKYYTTNFAHYGFIQDSAVGISELNGSVSLTLDANYCIDILSDSDFEANMASYPILVLAEQDNISNELIEKCKSYVSNGGNLIVTGTNLTSYFDDIMYITSDEGFFNGYDYSMSINKSTISMIGDWRKVRPLPNKSVSLSNIFHGRNLSDSTPYSAVLSSQFGKGQITCVYGNICANYSKNHYLYYRNLWKNIISSFQNSDKLVTLDRYLPLRLTYNCKNSQLQVNLINISSTNPTNKFSVMIDDVAHIYDFCVTIPLPISPKKVTLLSQNTTPSFTYEKGKLTVHIHELYIHDTILIE